jgi:DEAD/DEAH box helicase domain-containing protein
VVVRSLVELRGKYPLEVLTDAGVLPNYAFPEPGVTLRAMIEQDRDPEARRNADPPGAKKRRPTKRWESREYLRPASSALREFAPFNTFYAEGRHLKVTDLDLGTPERPSVSPWRFCPVCDHAEPAGTSTAPPRCPRCATPGWDDAGQRHELVAFRVARSFTSQHESLTVDASDDREEVRYRLADLIDVRPEHWGGAKASTSPLFGVELLHGLTLREVNFGPEDDREDTARVADKSVPAKGFVVCPECGRVQQSARDPGEGERADLSAHAVHCARRRGTSVRKELLSVWLAREVKSEAIRLLLPAATVDVDGARSAFRAALMLGLRRKFRGRPMHLEVKATSEPVTDRGDARRTFLVLYDAVPGGTGYLRELWRTDGLRECLALALEVLERCACRHDPERDGCYRCLLGHHTAFEKVRPSRRRAVDLLRDALGAWSVLTEVLTLSEVSVDTLLESELERRFVAVLQRHVTERGGTWTPTVHHGKSECARLTLGDETWLLEPQVDVAVSTGAVHHCRPDFVLWSQREGVLPLAVFCDGFEYHAHPGEAAGRIGDDFDKRAALLASERWRVWSITWADLKRFEGSAAEPTPCLFETVHDPTLSTLLGRVGTSLARDLHREDAMRTLVTWLRTPDEAAWRGYACALLLASLMGSAPVSHSALDAAEDALWTMPARGELPVLAGAGDALGVARRMGDVGMVARIPREAVRQLQWGALRAVLRLFDEAPRRADEGFRASWRALLLGWNLLQFHPRVAVISTEQDRASQRDLALLAEMVSEGAPVDDQWASVFDLVDGACEALARALLAASAPVPVVGEDVTQGGRVVGTAELAWPAAKVGVFLDAVDVPGWLTFGPTADVSRVCEAVKERSATG